jgi:hypothetical protein
LQPKHTPLKHVLADNLHVTRNYSEDLSMNIDSRWEHLRGKIGFPMTLSDG